MSALLTLLCFPPRGRSVVHGIALGHNAQHGHVQTRWCAQLGKAMRVSTPLAVPTPCGCFEELAQLALVQRRSAAQFQYPMRKVTGCASPACLARPLEWTRVSPPPPPSCLLDASHPRDIPAADGTYQQSTASIQSEQGRGCPERGFEFQWSSSIGGFKGDAERRFVPCLWRPGTRGGATTALPGEGRHARNRACPDVHWDANVVRA
jgi:hypothetical protein